MFSQLRAIVWSAMHYPSAAPLCSLHSASSSCNSCVSRSRFAHASSRSCSGAAAVPLALIFQQRHSIRRRPCHRLLPEDPDPSSAPACLGAPTSTARRGGVEASRATLEPPPSSGRPLTTLNTPQSQSLPSWPSPGRWRRCSECRGCLGGVQPADGAISGTCCTPR